MLQIGIRKNLSRFNNLETIKSVSCPSLIIHGQRDKLIPFSHSVELSKNCGGPFDLVFPENMNHNDFGVYEDLIEPLFNFMKRHNLFNSINNEPKIILPLSLYDIPNYYYLSMDLPNKDRVTHFLRNVLKLY